MDRTVYLDGFASHPSGYRFVYVDIMNITHVQPRSSPDVKNILDMMILSMKDSFRSFMCGRRSDKPQKVHVHGYIPSVMIHQKKTEQERTDGRRSGVDETSNAFVNVDAEYDVSWPSVMRDRTEKDFVASAYMWASLISIHALNRGRGKWVRKSGMYVAWNKSRGSR